MSERPVTSGASGQPSAETLQFTVAISTLDRREILESTLDALCDVDLSAVREVLVVDQSEKPIDGTRWASQLPIRVVHQRARGLGRSRNEVIEQAKTELILFLDDDVVPAPDIVTEHARSYARHPRAVGVAGFEQIATSTRKRRFRAMLRNLLVLLLRPYLRRDASYRRFLDEQGRPVGLVLRSGLLLCDFARSFECLVMTPRGCNMSFRRSALLGAGGFDRDWAGPRRDETDMALRLLRRHPDAEIWFNPRARVQHWMAASGGCRSGGRRLRHRRDFLCELFFARRHLPRVGRALCVARLVVTRMPWVLLDPVLWRALLGGSERSAWNAS